MQPAKRSNGLECYKYIFLYTDDALVVSENTKRLLRQDLGQYFTLQEESIGHPKIYLGGSLMKIQIDNGVKCWYLSSSLYVYVAVENVEDFLVTKVDINWKLPAKAETPIHTSCRPKIDVSPELGHNEVEYYMSLIDMMGWMAEIVRVDKCLK